MTESQAAILKLGQRPVVGARCKAGKGFGTVVWRPGWSGLADQKQVDAGLDLLTELGHLEAWQEPTRTKPRTLYVVNPKALPLASTKHCGGRIFPHMHQGAHRQNRHF